MNPVVLFLFSIRISRDKTPKTAVFYFPLKELHADCDYPHTDISLYLPDAPFPLPPSVSASFQFYTEMSYCAASTVRDEQDNEEPMM